MLAFYAIKLMLAVYAIDINIYNFYISNKGQSSIIVSLQQLALLLCLITNNTWKLSTIVGISGGSASPEPTNTIFSDPVLSFQFCVTGLRVVSVGSTVGSAVGKYCWEETLFWREQKVFSLKICT